MNKKSLILSTLLVLIVLLCTSAVSAEDSQIIDDNLVTASASEVTVKTTDTNDQIQEKINSLHDGDTLTFEKGDYKDILLYVNSTSITINGNGATLHGYDNLVANDTRIPDIILNKTTQGGYGISNPATLYILKSDNLVLKDISIIAGANSGTDKGADTARYSNCLVYNYQSANTQILNSKFEGSTWGIYYFQSTGGIIEGNTVKNQGVTGIFNFQTPKTIIRNNTVINAKNHGIDVRHMIGPNVQVLNNKIVGAKEGIYLLHSGKHTVTGNTILNCSLSSITCCGANNILIENNTLQNSRIGVLLSGSAPVGGSYVGYTNITIGTNQWKLDQLPFPPSFVFYVAEAKSDYATVETMMGTHSDSLYGDTYVNYTGINPPEPVVIDYDDLLKPTATTKTITSGMTSAQIQETINSMNNGDTLIFEENAVFEDICIYIDKNIKVIGNNATLKGVNSVSYDYIPEIVTNKTTSGGYAIPNIAILYVLNTTGVVISNLNIVSNYPKYTMPCVVGDNDNYRAYYSTGIYGGLSKNLTITGCSVNGASWGIFLGGRPDGDYKYGCQNAIITKNNVKNQYTTGIINFASPNSIIANNTVTNAVNHGIDVRFPAGFGAKVFNNTISGSKEGIYLLHSYGHYVYNNKILNSKISSITCYGSHDEYIFNNTLTKSRVAILLGGSADNSFYNVTIGPNTFDGDKLPFPPTFAFTLVKSENQYQTPTDVIGTYSDKLLVKITADDVETPAHTGNLTVTLIDQNGEAVANKPVKAAIGNGIYSARTDSNGIATITLDLIKGDYTAEISFEGSDNYAKATGSAKITVTEIGTKLITPSRIISVANGISGYDYQFILKDENGNALADKEVSVSFNGKTQTVTTDENGWGTATVKAGAQGTYNVEVTFAGDDSYSPITQTATIKLIKEKTSFIAPDRVVYVQQMSRGYTYSAILKDQNGNALANKKVLFIFDGKKQVVMTDENGWATVKLTAVTAGTQTVTIKFAGTASCYYETSTTKTIKIVREQTKLIVPDKTFTVSGEKTVTATLISKSDNPVNGAKVTLSVNGKTYTATTNFLGIAVFSIDLTNYGTYTATTKFADSRFFAATSTTSKIYIN
ncbi:MAG: Ig-like domain-containing protein [Methanobrevibacter sp.]|nr:Ig-like domain-containing protein [Methanobrevibacter sp.]